MVPFKPNLINKTEKSDSTMASPIVKRVGEKLASKVAEMRASGDKARDVRTSGEKPRNSASKNNKRVRVSKLMPGSISMYEVDANRKFGV